MTLTTHVEEWSAFEPEFRGIIQEHWEDLALDKGQIALAPDWETYRMMGSTGRLLVVTLRNEASELVGYLINFVIPDLHYGVLSATMDIFYVRVAFRNRFGGLRLMRATRLHLKALGVQRWFMGSKLHKDIGRLFVACGFRPMETWYSSLV